MFDTFQTALNIQLTCTENLIAGIAQAWDDVAVFVQVAVERGSVDGTSGCASLTAFTPSGAATNTNALMLRQPLAFKRSMVEP